MKITKRLIDAIVNIAQEKNRKQEKEEIESLKRNKSLIKKAAEYKSYLHKIPVEVRKKMYYNEKDFLDVLVDMQPKKTPFFNRWVTENTIIVEAEQSKNLDELFKRLKLDMPKGF